MTQSTSATLLARLRDPSDEVAWSRFVDLYAPLLFRWARRRGLPAGDTADLVQEVLAALVRKLPEFDYDPARCFRSWLRTVAFNKYRDLLRSKAPRPHAPDDPTLDVPATDNECFEEVEYRRYLHARALEIVRRDFAEATWHACRLAVTTDRAAADIGAELGLTEGAVYAAKFRVLKRLRSELAGLADG